MSRGSLDAELEIREAHCKKLEALIQLKERRLEALRHAGARDRVVLDLSVDHPSFFLQGGRGEL